VCAESLRSHSSIPLNIVLLDQSWLRRIGLYRRTFYERDGQRYDTIDGRPFSTEFSFTRFLVPSLQPDGWALFVDGDFLFRADVAELFAHQNPRFAVMCVQHRYQPDTKRKMLGQVQEPYPRKNWSSLCLWNCGHHQARYLTPYLVNNQRGDWLHAFTWMDDENIGALPDTWNWLDGHDEAVKHPKAVHFTRGTPDMPGWEDTYYADEWRAIAQRLQ
jgi:lipopolysaccharide biosynthesis glycosyltransferase